MLIVGPVRDEARRIGPLLDALRGAPGVAEVLVVDDESSDDTGSIAAAGGARVIAGGALPGGWAGKAWALQQGLEAATGAWVVTLDADTRPDPILPATLVARATRDGLDLVTVAASFECPTRGTRWLHPALLTTLVYRFGPPDSLRRRRPTRLLANGQCMAFERSALLAAGGLAAVSGSVVEDVALARHLAGRGWAVAMVDGASLLQTRMFESAADAWRGWSRSLALPGVEPLRRQLVDLGIVLVAQAVPLPRLLLRRGDRLDAVLLAIRIGTLAGTCGAYTRRGAPYWLSPLADLPAAAALAAGIVRRRHRWRGRTYD
jgi:dolichol-phosphate mannosyltransferase